MKGDDPMNEQDTGVKRRRRRDAADMGPQPRWPGNPESVEASAVDFDAIAHLLANTCRWGGRTRRYISFASACADRVRGDRGA